MADKIKGITIEINGDTTPLSKALAEVNSQSKRLQDELYSVEKLLKFDPTNTELLAQKQKILAEQKLKLKHLNKHRKKLSGCMQAVKLTRGNIEDLNVI